MQSFPDTSAATHLLASQIQQWTGQNNQMETAISGLRLSRWTSETQPVSYTHKSSLCLIAQGKKRVFLGEECFVYDANHFLISSVDLPVIANIMEASEEKPYLGIILELDMQEISQLIVDSQFTFESNNTPSQSLAVGQLSLPILDAFTRLVALLDEPANINILAPLIKREIFYRLLQTEQGARRVRLLPPVAIAIKFPKPLIGSSTISSNL